MPPKFTILNIWLLVIAMNVGRFLRSNPFLLGKKSGWTPPTPEEFVALADHPALDRVLDRYKQDLGDDYECYRNHCLRVLSFSVWFLQQNQTQNVSSLEMDIMATALAYHDIALWTDGTLNYLDPSVSVFESDLQHDRKLRNGAESEREVADEAGILPFSLDESQAETVREIILQHHRYNKWKKGDSFADESLVNAVRKADWADATLGVMRSGLPVNFLEAAYETAPSLGFHAMLAGMGARLSPDSYVGRLDVLKILKW